MLWILLGFAGILAGVVVIMLGSMIGGFALMLAGMIVMAKNYVTMMRGRGYDPEQGSIHGPGGQGKQQSDAAKVPQPGSGEQPANIWEMVEEL